MPSRSILDPQLAALIDLKHDVGPGAGPSKAMEALLAVSQPTSPLVESREVFVPGPPGAPDVRGLLYTPKNAPKTTPSADRPAILQIHGGGYVMGAPELNTALNLKCVEDFGAVVLATGYRLAPQTKFPGAVEDCYAALAWLHRNADALGVDRTRIAVSGPSAGGGLAAALALLARDRREWQLCFQHLIYPMIDDRTAVHAEPSPFVGQFVWTREANAYGWSALLDRPPGSPGVSPYAAAARAEDLSGLPPTYIACGSIDLFVEENLDYARRLVRAGVPTEVHIYPGAPHGFTRVLEAQVTKDSARDSLAALGRALAKRA